MFLKRVLSGLLMAFLLIPAIVPADLAAQEVCTRSVVASSERALLQAQGQPWLDIECTDGCENDADNALLSYERAVLQAQGERLLDIAACADGCPTITADTLASYERAVLQAQGQVMSSPAHATCGVVA